MGARLGQLVVDAEDPPIQAMWWAAALGWQRTLFKRDDWFVLPHRGEPGVPLLFLAVPEFKTRQNRLHWDLPTTSQEEFDGQIEALRRGGARRADVGQGDVPWQVLADPEGNEFCVLEPREFYRDARPVAALVVPAQDPAALAGFWEQALGWRRTDRELPSLRDPSGTGPYLEFVPATEPPPVKDRLHLDLVPTADSSREQETQRLLGLGASRVDIGQDDVDWDVLADPEGNVFCVIPEDVVPAAEA